MKAVKGSVDSDSSRSKSKLDKEKKKGRTERGSEEKKKGRGRSDGGGKEDKEAIDGSQSSDVVLQRKRKRKKAHRLGDDSLASIGLDDISPPFKKSKEMIKKSSSAVLHYLAGSVPLDSVTQATKTSRSESSLDTLQGRVNKRARGSTSILCNIAGTGTATGTGIRAKAGSKAGTGGVGAGKEKVARSKALVRVTQKDNDHDIR